jgi:NTE family protein
MTDSIARDQSSSDAPREQALLRAASPVHLPSGAEPAEPTSGVALCLSGGGYRAMLFHAGALWRLNELGWLRKLDRVSSVSGGSITAGVLGHRWIDLTFDENGVATNFVSLVVSPLHALADETIDFKSIALHVLLPGSIAMGVANAYGRHLFGDATLQSLPTDEEGPRFVFNATSLQSGVLRRFSRPYAWDYRVGKVENPEIKLAVAVAASSAFPPFLSPLILRLPAGATVSGSGEDLERPPFTTRLVLADGGVYDNLGLETAWHEHRTVLISDGGGHMAASERPKGFWPLQVLRVLSVIDNQVRSLRKRQAIDAYAAHVRDGTYWGIRTDIADYGLSEVLAAPHAQTMALAALKTRLGRMPRGQQERLVNWGYAVCDAAMRRHVVEGVTPPSAFPYAGGVG